MPHNGCDRSPLRQLRPLCRHSRHCSDPVRTCLTLLPPLCCQLLVLLLLQDPRQAWGSPSNVVRTLTRARPLSAGPSAPRQVKHGGQYSPQQPPCRPLEPQGADAFSAGLKGFQGQLLRPTPCSPVPGNSNPPLFSHYSGGRRRLQRSLHTCTPPLLEPIKGGGGLLPRGDIIICTAIDSTNATTELSSATHTLS